LERATRTILLLTTIFLSLMLLSEAINYAPKVPIILHISDHNDIDSNPDNAETPGSIASIESGRNLSKENLFEIIGIPKTSYIRQNALEVYEEGYWFPFNVLLKTYDHRPIEHFNRGFTGELTSFIVNPLFPMTGFIPSVIYTSEIGGSEQLILYPNQLAFYSKTSIGPYPSRYYERLTQSYLLENSQLLTTGRYIEVPVNVYEKLRPLALNVTEGSASDYSKLRAIEHYLMSHYTYDLNYNSPPEGFDPVEWFLFEDKRGVCWHFNSAFVLLARSLGLPARLVIGYLVKPNVEYQIVKADQLHAWVEAEFEGYGWVTFDASPGQIQDIENPGTMPTNTTITSQDTVCLKGKTFNVEGRVTAPKGLVNNVKAIAYMKLRKVSEAIPVGFAQVVNGSYRITCEAPRYLNIGNYQIEVNTVPNKIYIGSSSDPPIVLKAETFFNVSLPSMVIANRPFNIEGVLQETETSTVVSNFFYYLEADEPTLINASVIDNEIQPMLVRLLEADESHSIDTPTLSDLTFLPSQKAIRNIYELWVGPSGKINIYRSGLPSGNYSYTLRWNGTEYLLPASNNKVIWAIPLTVTPETPENIFRSETTQITGTIHAMNLTGDHELIHITKDEAPMGSVTSDNRGVFKLPLTIPQDHTLGKITIEYALDRNNYRTTKDATIYARTQLSTLPQNLGYWYTPFNITGKLTNDFNESMPGINLTLSYVDGGAPTNWTVATDESGFAVFPIKLTSSPSSDRFHFNLTSQGYGFYFPSRLEGDVSFVPVVDYVGSSLQIILPVVSITALLYFSKRFVTSRGFNTSQKLTSKASVSEVEESPPIQIDEPNLGLIKLVEKDFSINIEAPQIRPPYPAVWGLNDPLTLKITLKDKRGKTTPHTKLAIIDGEESFSFETSDRGEFEITKSYGNPGFKEVKFHYNDEKREAEAIFRVRIVEYRNEVIRLLNEYFENVKDDVDFGNKNTVREIVEAIKLRTPKSKHQALETIVNIFEEAEYSLHPINRVDYERFYSAETKSLEAVQV
jgi:transglutaminase-like putative cysteine protease